MKKDVYIEDNQKNILFSRKNLEFPENYSQNACNIIAYKYMSSIENSWIETIERVVKCFPLHLQQDLTEIFYNQEALLNSPVWFNLGLKKNPVTSACFISSVEDNLNSIMDEAKLEVQIFKHGAGIGLNLSKIRGKNSMVTGGGTASGVVSFIRGYDVFGGIIKSGGKIRRSASMRILDINHDDINEFILCKMLDERKAKMLIRAGFTTQQAYENTFFQNGTHSVGLDSSFWQNTEKYKKEIENIKEAIYESGDPGILFFDNINKYSLLQKENYINSSNPCGEFLFLENSACNLSTINIAKISNADRIRKIASVLVQAQDFLIDFSYYPSAKIKENTIKYRPLCIGLGNIGGFLMDWELPYSSINGRLKVQRVSEILLEAALEESSRLCLEKPDWQSDLALENFNINKNLLDSIKKRGLKNAHVTGYAPTGTVGIVMDFETSGVEPYLNIKTLKKCSDNSEMFFISEKIKTTLKNLGYKKGDITKIYKNNSVKGIVNPEHEDIFKTSFDEYLALTPKEHIDMVATIQKNTTSGISKTVNLPENISKDKIWEYIEYAHNQGLKGITFYRNHSKSLQPINTVYDTEQCPVCKKILVSNGSCLVCSNCGLSTKCSV